MGNRACMEQKQNARRWHLVFCIPMNGFYYSLFDCDDDDDKSVAMYGFSHRRPFGTSHKKTSVHCLNAVRGYFPAFPR